MRAFFFFLSTKGWNLYIHTMSLFKAVLWDVVDSFQVCCYYPKHCWNSALETASGVNI